MKNEHDISLSLALFGGAVGGGRDVAPAPCPGSVRDVVLDHVQCLDWMLYLVVLHWTVKKL